MKRLYKTKKSIVRGLWQAGAVNLRDVPPKITNEWVKELPKDDSRRPHLYASGNWGPGYIFVKGTVSLPGLFNGMVNNLSEQLVRSRIEFDFVAGLMTGGAIPGYRLSQIFRVPFVYLEGTRKQETISAKIIDGNKMEKECESIVRDIAECKPDFIAGTAPHGMIPGFRISQLLSEKTGRDVPFAYVRSKRKKGGMEELVTHLGLRPNSSAILIANAERIDSASKDLREDGFEPIAAYRVDDHQIEIPIENIAPIQDKGRGIVTEELVNFAGSTSNAVLWLRELGYTVEDSVAMLTYENPEAIQCLKRLEVKHHYIVTLSDLLNMGKQDEYANPRLIQEYKRYLKDPLRWQAERGLTPVAKGGTL